MPRSIASQCNYCGRKFATTGGLTLHIKSAHVIQMVHDYRTKKTPLSPTKANKPPPRGNQHSMENRINTDFQAENENPLAASEGMAIRVENPEGYIRGTLIWYYLILSPDILTMFWYYLILSNIIGYYLILSDVFYDSSGDSDEETTDNDSTATGSEASPFSSKDEQLVAEHFFKYNVHINQANAMLKLLQTVDPSKINISNVRQLYEKVDKSESDLVSKYSFFCVKSLTNKCFRNLPQLQWTLKADWLVLVVRNIWSILFTTAISVTVSKPSGLIPATSMSCRNCTSLPIPTQEMASHQLTLGMKCGRVTGGQRLR